jgi:hypothetical protein
MAQALEGRVGLMAVLAVLTSGRETAKQLEAKREGTSGKASELWNATGTLHR